MSSEMLFYSKLCPVHGHLASNNSQWDPGKPRPPPCSPQTCPCTDQDVDSAWNIDAKIAKFKADLARRRVIRILKQYVSNQNDPKRSHVNQKQRIVKSRLNISQPPPVSFNYILFN